MDSPRTAWKSPVNSVATPTAMAMFYAAEARGGEVGDVPFGAIGRENRDAVTFPDPYLGHRLRHRSNAAKHLLGRYAFPAAARFVHLCAR